MGIRCSIRMEVPLGDAGNILVSPEYVRFLVDVANQKMEANRKRTQGFFIALKENGFVGPTDFIADSYDPESADGDGDGDKQNGNLNRNPYPFLEFSIFILCMYVCMLYVWMVWMYGLHANMLY